MSALITRRQFILSSMAVASTSVVTAPAVALTPKWGDRPMRIIVPFAAGGGVDVFARLIAEKLRQKNDLTTIIENRAGANGLIGGNAVKNAQPDGATLLFSAATHVMARHVMKSASYDPIADFAPIARVGEAPMMLIVSPRVSASNIVELIDDVRKAPEKWTWATSSLGAPGHLAELDFNRLSGLNLLIQPYRGTAPALNDVAGGHVQLMIDPVLALLPLANAKQVKGLAVTTARRTPLAPGYATASESGLTGMDHSSWYGVWGPKKMSADLVAQLNERINNAVQELKNEGQLAKLGIEPVSETSSQFETFAKGYVTRNAALPKASSFEQI